jgi:GGDEF domain-containing protein
MSELPPSSDQDPQDRVPVYFQILYEQALEREGAEREEKEYWHYEATHDKLTGLPNSRGLEEMLEANPAPQALLFIDSDKLKLVNDRLGHLRGDEAIQISANLIISSIRPTDKAARVGGDEFVVILDPHKRADTESDPGNPENIAEIDGLILNTKRRFSIVTREVLARDENSDLRNLGFRLSVGGAVWQEGMTVADLLDLADEDMYRDKGRRRRQ